MSKISHHNKERDRASYEWEGSTALAGCVKRRGGFVRVVAYTMFGGRRSGAGGSLWHFKDRFEPVPGIEKSAKVEVVSTSKEKMTLNGKKYNGTKIVRKIDRPLDESVAQASWTGTSILWVCHDVPLRLVKMGNAYKTQMSMSDKGQKRVETWILAESGFKNWKED